MGGASPRLAQIFEKDKRILLVYLFGSRSMGRETRESDVDIGFLLSELPGDLLDYYLYLVDRLSGELRSPVDLVLLNAASPLLKHQVVKNGKVLYSRDQRTHVEFEARSESEYLDLSLRRRQYDKVLVEEVSSWKK